MLRGVSEAPVVRQLQRAMQRLLLDRRKRRWLFAVVAVGVLYCVYFVFRTPLLQATVGSQNAYVSLLQPRVWWANYWRSQCTLEQPYCFELERCCGNFSVYLYPHQGNARNEWADAFDELRQTLPYVTADPTQACVLVPNLGAFQCCSAGRQEITQELQRLPHWNEGRNHAVLDYRDWYWQHMLRDWSAYDIDQAISFKSSMPTYGYRDGFDVALPFPRRVFDAEVRRAVSGRDVFAYFQGSCSVAEGEPQIRRDVVRLLHNPARGYIAVDTSDRSTPNLASYNYVELMGRTKYALVPRGYGLHTHRLIESLSAGAVPVILKDEYVLPFSEFLDWDSFSVRVPESRVAEVPDILAAIPETRYLSMQRTGVAVYEAFFSSKATVLRHALEIVHDRVRAALRRHPDRCPADPATTA